MTTRVAVNLMWLRPGIVGGSEELVTAYVRTLSGHSDIELTLFVNHEFGIAHPDLVSDVPTIAAPALPGGRVSRVALESTWLARRTYGFDVVHHAGGTVPSRSAGPVLVTIHDLQPLDRPDAFGTVKRRWLARQLPRSVERADAIHVTSSFVAEGIAERFGRNGDKVVIVPPVVHLAEAPTAASPDSARLDRLGVTSPFVLYPAITYPHKNHEVLLDAMAMLRVGHPDLQLVLCGGAGPNESVVRARIGPMDRRLGRVTRTDLEALLRAASVLAFPSRYEGFGLPVVEAMIAGTPVVAADAGALPGVLDGAGTLVGPDDVKGWADAIDRLLDDSRAASASVDAGRRRAVDFGADSVRGQLESLYEAVGSGSIR